MNSLPPEHSAAQLTLLALLSTLPNSREVSANQYLFLPDTIPASRNEAIELLAAAAKPLACVSLPVLGLVGVAIWPMSSLREEIRGFVERSSQQYVLWLRERFSMKTEARFIARVRGEELLLSRGALELWFASYYLPLGTTEVTPASPDLAASGISGTISFTSLASRGLKGRPA